MNTFQPLDIYKFRFLICESPREKKSNPLMELITHFPSTKIQDLSMVLPFTVPFICFKNGDTREKKASYFILINHIH
jgi:hypothetical protein